MRSYILTGLTLFLVTAYTYGQVSNADPNEPLKAKIKKMLKDDQKYRTFISYGTLDEHLIDSINSLPDDEQIKYIVGNKKKLDKSVSDSLWILQNQIDLKNTIGLEKIVMASGWPSDESLGANISAEVLLFHTPTAKLESLKELLLKEVKEKRMDAKIYATFVDNMRLKHGQKQLYGTNIEFSRELMKEMPPTIENIDITNKKRKEIGLEVLKEGEYRIKDK